MEDLKSGLDRAGGFAHINNKKRKQNPYLGMSVFKTCAFHNTIMLQRKNIV